MGVDSAGMVGVDSAGVVVYGGYRFSRCGGVWWV